MNVKELCEKYGLERIGFLTLTFADHVLCAREAQRRFNSLSTNVLRTRYVEHIRVIERMKSGRIHYHLLVVLPFGLDIRTGFDFEAIAQQDYSTASPALRAEWAYLRRTLKAFGFGRSELLPIKSTAEGIGKYVGKYIAKHIGQRETADKGVRLVAYTRGATMANTRFAWVSPGAKAWRFTLGEFCHFMHEHGKIGTPTFHSMALQFGPRWAYLWRDVLLNRLERSQS